MNPFSKVESAAKVRRSLREIWESSKAKRAFRHRDFRLMWFGSFISFLGSWIQTVAQGFLVYELTGSKERLALVSFYGMLPVAILGLFAGTVVDRFDKRKLLIITQIAFALGSIYLAVARYNGFLKIQDILAVALLTGVFSAFEMPARQAIVGETVPKEDIGAAIPFQALTFNLARVVGPAIGGWLLASFGVEICYIINAVSFSALIFGAIAMRTDMTPKTHRDAAIWDLITEGMRYTWHEPRLRRLLILEVFLSFFALFYLAQLPAIAFEILKLSEAGIGTIYTVIGFGAVSALGITATLSDRPIKGTMIKLAMTGMAFGMLAVSFTRSVWLAYPLFYLMGLCTVIQFNTTNTLFQLISPEKLRGRVISMHVWALSGIGPFGTYLFGWIAEKYGLPLAFQIGSLCVLFGVVIWGWGSGATMEAEPSEQKTA